MWNKILVAYDGSPSSDVTLSKAVDLVKSSAVKLYVICVIEPPQSMDLAPEDYIQTNVAMFEDKFAEALEKNNQSSKGITLQILSGIPAESILEFAEQNNIDLILVGPSNKSMLDRLMLGSTSKEILNRATCSVLLVR